MASHTETDELNRLKRRGLVNRKPLSNAIDLNLWNKLDDLAKKTGINKSRLLDQAIILLLNHYQSHPSIEKSPLIQLNEDVTKR